VSAKVKVIDGIRHYDVERAVAREKISTGAFRWLDPLRPFQIVRVVRGTFDGWLGTGNAIPFARIQNRLRKPAKLHYEIPAIGARSRPQWCSQINEVPEADAA